jgi:hypothetical protein
MTAIYWVAAMDDRAEKSPLVAGKGNFAEREAVRR